MLSDSEQAETTVLPNSANAEILAKQSKMTHQNCISRVWLWGGISLYAPVDLF